MRSPNFVRSLVLLCACCSLLVNSRNAGAVIQTYDDILVANEKANTLSAVLNVTGDQWMKLDPDQDAGNNPNYVTTADFNNDGLQDAVLVNGRGNTTLTFLLGQGNGQFSAPLSYNLGYEAGSTLSVGDFNNDGNMDVCAADWSGGGAVEVLLGDGQLKDNAQDHFASGGKWTDNVGAGTLATAAADFDKDGILDAVVTNWNDGSVTVLYGDGQGSFSRTLKLAVGIRPQDIAAADFNANGRMDIAVAHGISPFVTVYLGIENGFSDRMDVATYSNNGEGSNTLAAADFNRDGYPDLVTDKAFDREYSIVVYLWDPAAQQFTPEPVSVTPVDDNFSKVAATDVDRDGKADVIIPIYNFNAIAVYFGDGAGGFTGSRMAGVGGGPISVAVVDINPVEHAYTTVVKVSNGSSVLNDLKEFSALDKLTVTLEDTRLSKTAELNDSAILIRQKKLQRTALFQPGLNGVFTASVELAGFDLGEAQLEIKFNAEEATGGKPVKVVYKRDDTITIRRALIDFNDLQEGVDLLAKSSRKLFSDFAFDGIIAQGRERPLYQILLEQDPQDSGNLYANCGYSPNYGIEMEYFHFNRTDIDPASVKADLKILTSPSGAKAVVFDNLTYATGSEQEGTIECQFGLWWELFELMPGLKIENQVLLPVTCSVESAPLTRDDIMTRAGQQISEIKQQMKK